MKTWDDNINWVDIVFDSDRWRQTVVGQIVQPILAFVSMFAIFFVLMTFNGQKDTLKARVIVSAIISAICSVLFWFQINRHDIFG
jgi:hypothetical protein